MKLTPSDLNTVRQKPQRTKLYLTIFEPRTVMKARLNNGSAQRGDRTLPYDGVSLGSYLDVAEGMTLLVGTTEGGSDLGKIRIKSADGSEFEVAENAIPFANDVHLTVLRIWELWAKYPRIINDANNAENVLWFKDWDEPYTDQNSILGSFVNAGSHRGLFKGESAYYTSTGTVNLLGDSLVYDWHFEGGTPTGSTSAHPGLVTYSTPGDYVTRLTVSGSSGGVDTTYRFVSVRDRLGEGDNPPITNWEIVSELGGSRDEGGYTATFRVREDVPITENAVVILFAEDWYGSTKQSFAASQPNNGKVFFVGHVLQGSIRKNWQDSYVEFSVGSITEVMKQAVGFSISVESKASPSEWYELLDMDGRRALYHYLKWHTTALSIADFQFLAEYDPKIQYFDADRTSMFDAIDNFMRNSLLGTVTTDRQGKIWAEVDARAYSNPTGTFQSVMEVTKQDWMNEPAIEERFSDAISYLEIGGIAYSGVNTGTYSALLACAPGSAPGYRGTIEMPDGLALINSDQLVDLVGNVYANENSKYPMISMDMTENLRNLDIAPQEATTMSILPTDTPRNVAINGLYIPNGMSWRYDHRNQILLPNISFKNLVNGDAAEVVNIPAADESGNDGFNVPGLQVPPLPPFSTPSSQFPSTSGSSCCDYIWDFLGLGLQATDIVLVNNGAIDGVGTGSVNIKFPYASNLNMYDQSTGFITILENGTYHFEMFGEWWRANVLDPNLNSHIRFGHTNGTFLPGGGMDAWDNCSGHYPYYGCLGIDCAVATCSECHGRECNVWGGNDVSLSAGDELYCYVVRGVGAGGITDDLWYNLRITLRKVS